MVLNQCFEEPEPVPNYLSYKINSCPASCSWCYMVSPASEAPSVSKSLPFNLILCPTPPSHAQAAYSNGLDPHHPLAGSGNQHTVLFLSHRNAGRKCSSSSLLNLQPYNSVYSGVNAAPLIHSIWVSGLNHRRAKALPQLPQSGSKRLHAYLENNRHELLHEKYRTPVPATWSQPVFPLHADCTITPLLRPLSCPL